MLIILSSTVHDFCIATILPPQKTTDQVDRKMSLVQLDAIGHFESSPRHVFRFPPQLDCYCAAGRNKIVE